MHWRTIAKNRLRSTGYDIVRYPLMRYLSQERVSTVLDVGANRGQYAMEMRRLGFEGNIISFEPIQSAFDRLSKASEGDAAWRVVHTGLGQSSGMVTINVSANTTSSSFLGILPRHTAANSSSAFVDREEVQVQRLDALVEEYCEGGERLFLKIDTQGYEMEVLEGAVGVFGDVVGLQVELSLLPLYEDQPLIEEIVSFLRSHGFVPTWFIPGFKDAATQRLMQVDGLFLKSEEGDRP